MAAIRIAVAISLLTLALLPSRAFAIEDPDTLLVNSIDGFTGVLETDDLLLIATYTIDYDTLPAEAASDAFVGRVVRGSTELNSTEPFAFNNRGYGLGAISWYWTPQERADASIEHDDPNGEAYAVRIQGKPGVFPGSVPSVSMNTITWADATRTQELLETLILAIANDLELDPDWSANNQDLVGQASGRIILTSTGETYFSNVVPNLSAMAPNVFSSSQTSPPIFERDHSSQPIADEARAFFNGTFVETWFDTAAADLSVNEVYVRAGLGLFALVAIVVLVRLWFRDAANGIEMGLLSLAITIPLAAYWGLLSFTVFGIIAFLAFAAVGWMMFGRKIT